VIATVHAGPLTVRGVSVGGIYTSIHVPELDVLFDVGIALRSTATVGTLLLSHGHADHAGAIASLLGIRALHNQKTPLRMIMPEEIVAPVLAALEAMTQLQRYPLAIEAIGLRSGDEYPLRNDLIVRATRTFHPVPSLAYQLVRRVQKLKLEYLGLPGPVIAARRRAGDDMFETVDHNVLTYATDTLIQVVEHAPELLTSKVVVMEATFLDDRKSREHARAGCHIHLDEVIERAEQFDMPHLVLMHFSQLYRPDEISAILTARLPPSLRARTQAFAPSDSSWPG
jgi:ribonuclease Z